MVDAESSDAMPMLYYSSIRGIAEPIRNLLYYLGIKFLEISVESGKDMQAGFNSGYPKLVLGNSDITDVVAIFRHICRTYQRMDLLGLTPQNRAVINEFVFHYSDVRSKMMKKISEGAKLAWTKTEGEIYEIKLGVIKSIVEDENKIVKNTLLLYTKSKTFYMGYLTMVDFFFYEICFYVANFFGSVLKNHMVYRNFAHFLSFFETQEFFTTHKQQIMSRKIFMPFKEKVNEQIMGSFWEGDKNLIS